MKDLKKNENITELIDKSEILILQFGSDTCAPCKALRQRIDLWNEDLDEQIETRYIPIEEFPDISAEHGIFSAPTVLVYVMGKMTIRESGYFSLDEILGKIERYIGLIK